jgi:DNA-binding response OmpR family regulator
MVSFGRYRLDPAQFRLVRDGELIPLSPRPFDLLVALVARAGELVTREELLATVWKDAAVEASSLNAAMSVLRQALGPEGADLIETVPGRGYRFIGQVQADRAAVATGPAAPPPAAADAPATIAVAIVDDHAIVRVGVRTIVERSPGCRVVGEAGTVDEAGAMIAARKPDLLILDLMIGSEASLAYIRRWRGASAGMRVIVLSMYEEEEYARQALAAGAHGYVMKEQMIEELQQAIATVGSGGVWVSASLGRSIAKDYVDRHGASD